MGLLTQQFSFVKPASRTACLSSRRTRVRFAQYIFNFAQALTLLFSTISALFHPIRDCFLVPLVLHSFTTLNTVSR
jgi:hypothetical protein